MQLILVYYLKQFELSMGILTILIATSLATLYTHYIGSFEFYMKTRGKLMGV